MNVTEQRMYDDKLAGNPTVNETQVRRAGRLLDDARAAEALRAGDYAAAGSVQLGQTADERDTPAPTDESGGERRASSGGSRRR